MYQLIVMFRDNLVSGHDRQGNHRTRKVQARSFSTPAGEHNWRRFCIVMMSLVRINLKSLTACVELPFEVRGEQTRPAVLHEGQPEGASISKFNFFGSFLYARTGHLCTTNVRTHIHTYTHAECTVFREPQKLVNPSLLVGSLTFW